MSAAGPYARSGSSRRVHSGRTTRIAIDAMGGDNAPGVNIDGAIMAVRSIEDIEIVLVGDEATIRKEFARRSFSHPSVIIEHAGEVVRMDESPSVALRKKRNSSMHVGITMVRDKQVDAFISAGNTGAVMAIAAVILRTLEGIDRAAIAVQLPTVKGHTVLLDAGANVTCKAAHLYQFGIMGSIYAQYALGDVRPTVGILSIGEEETKGNDVTREAFELLAKSDLNFIGNVEAKLLYKGVSDVVVCDGFTGNIALKISESLAEMISTFLRGMFATNWRTKLGYMLVKPFLAAMKKRVDHAEVGGAPLLGIDGAVFISHGSSEPRAIRNGIYAAKRFVTGDVNGHIRECLAQNLHILDPKALESGGKPGFFERMKNKMGLGGREGD
ncbi:MAG: phosphate acyltransferase PlsX [Nitrospinae bacterium]|nr:phosphate acyltransferase PlsX [Nitrospinota bacterium]